MEPVESMRSRVGDLAKIAALIFAMGAIVFVLDALLASYQLASLILGVFAVEFFMRGRGLLWDATGNASVSRAIRLVSSGFGVAALGVVLVVVIGWGVGLVEIAGGEFTFVGLGLGLLTPLAQAARDEVLFRGAPLALLRGRVSDRYALPFVALLGSAPVLLQPSVTVVGVGLVVVAGWVSAVLVRLGRGLYWAWGVHAGLLFMLGDGMRGEFLSVGFGSGVWYPMAYASGGIGWLLLAVLVAGAAGVSVMYYRKEPGFMAAG